MLTALTFVGAVATAFTAGHVMDIAQEKSTNRWWARAPLPLLFLSMALCVGGFYQWHFDYSGSIQEAVKYTFTALVTVFAFGFLGFVFRGLIET